MKYHSLEDLKLHHHQTEVRALLRVALMRNPSDEELMEGMQLFNESDGSIRAVLERFTVHHIGFIASSPFQNTSFQADVINQTMLSQGAFEIYRKLKSLIGI